MGQQRHFDRVRGLVSGQSGVPEHEITLETRLVEDLGIDGDDGDELLEAFADEFNVDMSGMAPLNYFGDEPPIWAISTLIPIVARFNKRFRTYARHAMRGRRTLTVRSLVASARAQRWITPTQRPGDADPTEISVYIAVLALVVIALMIFVAGPAIIIFAVVISVFMGLNFFRSLSLLRRLDAAATHEEQALTATG
jgi:acyl carrier protein